MRLRWQLRPIDGITRPNARYGRALDEDEIASWFFIAFKPDQSRRPWRVLVVTHRNTSELSNHYATLRAAKAVALADAGARFNKVAA